MKPLYQTRATADVLIEVAGKLKTPVALPWKTAEEVAKSAAAATSSNPQSNPQSALRQSAMRYAEPQFDGDAATYPFHFLPYASLQFGDGSSAHLPWLQELPDPLTSAMWSSWVEINPQTAERLQLAQGDLVDVTSSQGTVRAPVMIFPGIAPDMIAMPVGQGHETFTRYASGRGVNPIAILAPADRGRHRRAGLGRDARQDRARRRRRRTPDHVCRRDARAPMRRTRKAQSSGLRLTMAHRWGMAVDLDTLHRVRCVRHGLPRREQHPDGRRPSRRRAAARCTGCASSATGKAIFPTSG